MQAQVDATQCGPSPLSWARNCIGRTVICTDCSGLMLMRADAFCCLLQSYLEAEVLGGLKGERLNASGPSLWPSEGGLTLILRLGAWGAEKDLSVNSICYAILLHEALLQHCVQKACLQHWQLDAWGVDMSCVLHSCSNSLSAWNYHLNPKA